MHTADISNCCLPWDLSYAWAYRVVMEFHNQANVEKSLKLPYAVNSKAQI